MSNGVKRQLIQILANFISIIDSYIAYYHKFKQFIVDSRLRPGAMFLIGYFIGVIFIVFLFVTLFAIMMALGMIARTLPRLAIVPIFPLLIIAGVLFVLILYYIFDAVVGAGEIRLYRSGVERGENGVRIKRIGVYILVISALFFPIPFPIVGSALIIKEFGMKIESIYYFGGIYVSLLIFIPLSQIGRRLYLAGKSVSETFRGDLDEIVSESFVLYLRSFHSDRTASVRRFPVPAILYFFNVWVLLPYILLFQVLFCRSLEERIASKIDRGTRLIAIGAPEKDVPTLGAVRYFVGDDERWKDVVRRLIIGSRAILLTPGITEGVIWELSSVYKDEFRHKSVVIVTGDNDTYEAFRKCAKSFLDLSLPYIEPPRFCDRRTNDIIGAVTFDRDGTAHIVFRETFLGEFLSEIIVPIKSSGNDGRGSRFERGKKFLSSLILTQGRIDRTRYIGALAFSAFLFAVTRSLPDSSIYLSLLVRLLTLLAFWNIIRASIKRIHDLGIGIGYWTLAAAALWPIALGVLAFMPGSSDVNRFGARHRGQPVFCLPTVRGPSRRDTDIATSNPPVVLTDSVRHQPANEA